MPPYMAPPPYVAPAPAPPGQGVPVMTPATRAPRGRRLGFAVLIVAVLLAVAGVAAFSLLRQKRDTTVSTTVAGSVTTGSATTAATTTADAAALAAGDSLVDEGRVQEAVVKYQAILEANPKNNKARTQLGTAYALMFNTKEEGESQLTLATEADPSNAKAWTFLGLVRFDLALRRDDTDYTTAKEALKKGLELDPNNALAHAFQGQIYAAEGRMDEALAEANKAVDMAPDDVYALSSLGYVHFMRDEWDQAAAQYQKAVGVQPNWAWLQLLLAESLQYTESYPEALAAAETSLKLGQGYEARGYRRMGHIYWEKGDTAQAEVAFQKSLQLDKTDDFAQWGLGGVWYEKGDYQNALSHLRAAATLSPNNAGYQAWLGVCYEALEMYPEARAALEKAVRLDPDRTDAKDALDRLAAAGY
jgi:tetratricopeptide (TPR) repeat protein